MLRDTQAHSVEQGTAMSQMLFVIAKMHPRGGGNPETE